MRPYRAYTYVELLVVVMIVGILTAVAIPRLQFGLVHRSKVEAAAWKIVTDLRRARSLAITNAATKPDGYGLNIKTTGGDSSYEIIDLATSDVVDSHTLDPSIIHTGRQSLQFNSFGALKDGSDSSVNLSTTNKTYTISVIAATGMVKCVEGPRRDSRIDSAPTDIVRPIPASPFF